MGRPSSYTEEIAKAICERLAEGESLRTICKDDGMPDCSTVFRWLGDDERAEFRKQYARARETSADHRFEEIVEIADDQTIDANSRRIMVDARKWVAGKLRPKVYGDKLELAGDPERPLIATIERVLVRANPPDTDR
jgi:hypothetical protein